MVKFPSIGLTAKEYQKKRKEERRMSRADTTSYPRTEEVRLRKERFKRLGIRFKKREKEGREREVVVSR